MIIITQEPISPDTVINQAKTDGSGGVVTYVGLIREENRKKAVLSVEYTDTQGKAENRLRQIASEITQKWPVENVVICHRIGRLKVGDINVVIAVAAIHRQEAFAACQYAIDQFKRLSPTHKIETYQDGTTWTAE